MTGYDRKHQPVLRPPVESAQYTSLRFTEHLEMEGMARSIGTVGDAYDKGLVSYCASCGNWGGNSVGEGVYLGGWSGWGRRVWVVGRAVRFCRWPARRQAGRLGSSP